MKMNTIHIHTFSNAFEQGIFKITIDDGLASISADRRDAYINCQELANAFKQAAALLERDTLRD